MPSDTHNCIVAVPEASGVKVKKPAGDIAAFLGTTTFSFLQLLLLNGHGIVPKPNVKASPFSSEAVIW